MKRKILFIIIILASLAIYGARVLLENKESRKPKEELGAEQFIQKYLMKEDGRIQTNLQDQSDIYLSETVGLWMDYLLEKDDYDQFEEAVHILKSEFLNEDYLVFWELRGEEKASANAFIDDLRIMSALYRAGEQWNHRAYTKLAEKVEASLLRYQSNDGWFVDHIDLENKGQAETITLSYIIPEGFERMNKLPAEWYDQTKQLLSDAPVSPLGFFPKSYDLPTKTFSFDPEINLIDQFYVGYHRAQWGGDVEPLVSFAKSTFERDHKLYGRYDLQSGEPSVLYEAASVYALAILMCLEIEDTDFAKQLYEKLQAMQQTDKARLYYGGFIDIDSTATHTFDNLLALLAERKGIDENIFSH
ncbi:prenyltransferase/squalene oxidase repeat-containing protein [Sporosarcina cascadiensis]|uniref:hypothetical protein n=1 Tax=Sporosarcina cascadiensis TaxID=2660747 RepID=UPI0018911E3F|nr:hypothetical protein [Sporosarcina cascadiensis]